MTNIDREALLNALHVAIDGDMLIDGDGEAVGLSEAGAADVTRWAVDALAETIAAAVDAARAEGYERGKANEHRRFRAVVDKALNDFAEGEWQDAFLVHDVDDDVSAVQATEAWFRDRLNLPTEATP